VEIQVLDKDLLSTDDFLGQAELKFEDVPLFRGRLARLPLHGRRLLGFERHRGMVEVRAWFEEAVGPAHPHLQRLGTRAVLWQSTLVSSPGVPKCVPLVVHGPNGWLFEEPFMIYVGVRLMQASKRACVRVGVCVGGEGRAFGVSLDGSGEGGGMGGPWVCST
jgi:hypothetical protein